MEDPTSGPARPSFDAIRVHQEWTRLLQHLLADKDWRAVLLLGPVDSGKSTLCSYLGAELTSRWRTARLDCDPGQSQIGIPGALALGAEPWGGGPPLAMWFLGALSPAGHGEGIEAGAARLADKAREVGFQRMVVDSWGYFGMGGGRALQRRLVSALRPDYIVAVQRTDELEPLLALLEPTYGHHIVRIGVSEMVRKRSQEQRRMYRQERYAAYFRDAASHSLEARRLAIVPDRPFGAESPAMRGRVVGLCGRDGFVVALGLVESWEPEKGIVRVFSPSFEANGVTVLRVGEIVLAGPGWEERTVR